MLQAALTGVHVSPADDRIRFHGIDDVEMRRRITPQSPNGDSSPFRGAFPRAAHAPPKPPLKGEVAPKGSERFRHTYKKSAKPFARRSSTHLFHLPFFFSSSMTILR